MAARRSAAGPRHRLDPDVRPGRVRLHVEVDPCRGRTYRGEVEIDLELPRSLRVIRLHAVDLRVGRARLAVAGRELRGEVAPEAKIEMIRVRFDETAPAGPATLKLRFSGKLRKDLCGLYQASVGGRDYAFTQLEAADARKFFPCFDEPSMKARFQLSVTTGSANAAISNAPIERREARSDGRITLHFAETPPLSTYLVALAVGELEASRPTRLGDTEIRLWHTPGSAHLTAFGLEATRECLARLEDYFALPYPYEKLDMVAVPDFEFGAMENAGAVFFRETLLLIDPERATLGEKKRAAEVICHELAHMWFGDLVTMAWWDDLWLNEAFATWMAFRVVDEWKPEWKMWHDFQHGRAAALERDALRHTHPIYCTVNTPEDANENFDLITYEKGAAVVRMLERYLGPARFRRGVRAYIRTHREGNAVAADLWRALSKASAEPVERIARAWIEQEGLPAVAMRVAVRGGAHVLQMQQERFFEQPPKRGSATRWPIPVVARVARGRRGQGKLVRTLLAKKRGHLALGDRPPRFVYGNAEEGGFFRPAHGAAELAALAASLDALPPLERMGLVDHQWALVRAGRASMGGFLELARSLESEEDADVLATLRKPLSFLAHALVPEAAPDMKSAFRAWLNRCFGPRFDALGWHPAVGGEHTDVRLRRAVLLGIVGGVAEVEEVLRTAGEHCSAYLEDRSSLDANLADAVVALAARRGDPALLDHFVAAMEESDTPQEKRRFMLATADFRNPELIRATLAMSLTDHVPTQDVVFLLNRLMANPAARDLTWAFIKRHWARLRKRMPSLFASRLIEATPQLLTADARRDVARFFRANRVQSGDRALRQALERFDWYRGFRRKAAPELTAWLTDESHSVRPESSAHTGTPRNPRSGR
ncbi:MAG: M1 family metallopeptidase [Myxococcota bacterium]